MNRNPAIEKVWKTRYNRDVEVYSKTNFNDEKEAIKTEVKIIYKGHKFFLTEYLKGGLTEYSTIQYGSKIWKHDTVLETDTIIADLIGRIENGDPQ